MTTQIEQITPVNISIEHMRGSITLRYTGADGKTYEQSGLGMCVHATKMAIDDSTFFTLEFESVNGFNPIKEIET